MTTTKVTKLSPANTAVAAKWIDADKLVGVTQTTVTFAGTTADAHDAIRDAYVRMIHAGLPRRGGDYQTMHAVRRRVEAIETEKKYNGPAVDGLANLIEL